MAIAATADAGSKPDRRFRSAASSRWLRAWSSPLLGAVVGGLLLAGMSIFAASVGSVILAGNGPRLLKPE